MFTYVDKEKTAKIKVIRVGGAGGSAINNMIRSGLQGVKFSAGNTRVPAWSAARLPTGFPRGGWSAHQ